MDLVDKCGKDQPRKEKSEESLTFSKDTSPSLAFQSLLLNKWCLTRDSIDYVIEEAYTYSLPEPKELQQLRLLRKPPMTEIFQ